MSEDECDLDVLVSLLDDNSNSGDVKQRDPPDNKSVGKGNGNSPQSSTLTKGPQPANEDEDCDIDSLAAFLEEDGDFEEGDTGNKLSRNKGISLSEERGGPSQSKPACTVISEPCEPSLSRTALDEMSEQEEEEDDETGDETNDDTDIQAELLNIQKKMLELQSQLKKRKKK